MASLFYGNPHKNEETRIVIVVGVYHRVHLLKLCLHAFFPNKAAQASADIHPSHSSRFHQIACHSRGGAVRTRSIVVNGKKEHSRKESKAQQTADSSSERLPKQLASSCSKQQQQQQVSVEQNISEFSLCSGAGMIRCNQTATYGMYASRILLHSQ